MGAAIFGKVGGFVVSILLGRMMAPFAVAAEGISVALVIVSGGDLQTAIVRRLIFRTALSAL